MIFNKGVLQKGPKSSDAFFYPADVHCRSTLHSSLWMYLFHRLQSDSLTSKLLLHFWFCAGRQKSELKQQKREPFKQRQSWNRLSRKSEPLNGQRPAPVLQRRENLKRPRIDRSAPACQNDPHPRRLLRRRTHLSLREPLPSNPHGLQLAHRQRKNRERDAFM